jgi:glycosyltransferase involved in cell wall biosynthesis
LRLSGCLGRVRFAGRLSEKDLLKGYQQSALGVYLGSGYGAAAQSLFVLEMMACGKPVMRANTTDSEVEDGKTGRLYPVHDIGAFEEAVVSCLRDKTLLRTMGENARRQIVEKYTWKRVAEHLEAYLRTLGVK